MGTAEWHSARPILNLTQATQGDNAGKLCRKQLLNFVATNGDTFLEIPYQLIIKPTLPIHHGWVICINSVHVYRPSFPSFTPKTQFDRIDLGTVFVVIIKIGLSLGSRYRSSQ